MNKATANRVKSMGQDLSWLWRHTAGCRLRLGLIVGYGLISTLLGLGVVWLTRYIIDYASSLALLPKGQSSSPTTLFILSSLLVGVFFTRIGVTTHCGRLATNCEISLRNRLRGSLFSRLTRSDYLTLIKIHTGDVIGRLDTDLPTITVGMAETLPNIIVATIGFVGPLVYLFLLSPTLCLLLLFMSPLLLLISRRRLQSLPGITESIRHTATKINTYIQDSLRNILVIKSFQAEPRVTATLRFIQEQLSNEIVAKDRLTTGSSAIVKLSFSTAYLVAFIWGIWGLSEGKISFGTLAAFLQLAGMVQRPLRRLGGSVSGLAKVGVAIDRIRMLEEIPPESDDRPTEEEKEASPTPTSLGIRIEGLHYRYPESDASLFDNFSAEFPPGSLTAIMGKTGSGKSTLLKLIASLLHPDSGTIYLYAANQPAIPSPPSLSLRDVIRYVPQGRSLLPGSIRENLLIGTSHISEDEINRALRVAVADEFIYRLPEGLDTVIGESQTLSEGEAQRLAIARALLRHGSVLILDEPTSALDPAVERRIIERLKASEGLTTIIVTHSGEVARLCDRVIRLDYSCNTCLHKAVGHQAR